MKLLNTEFWSDFLHLVRLNSKYSPANLIKKYTKKINKRRVREREREIREERR